MNIKETTRRPRGIPPLVGLLNLPARPLLPGGMLAVYCLTWYSRMKDSDGDVD